jgi:hypothetical protein
MILELVLDVLDAEVIRKGCIVSKKIPYTQCHEKRRVPGGVVLRNSSLFILKI